MQDFLAEQLFPSMLNTLLPLLLALVTAGAGRGLLYLNSKFKLDLSTQRMDEITKHTEVAVMAVSQEFRARVQGATGAQLDHINQQKRAAAVAIVEKRAVAIGADITEEQAGDLVEAEVNKLKRARGAL